MHFKCLLVPFFVFIMFLFNCYYQCVYVTPLHCLCVFGYSYQLSALFGFVCWCLCVCVCAVEYFTEFFLRVCTCLYFNSCFLPTISMCASVSVYFNYSSQVLTLAAGVFCMLTYHQFFTLSHSIPTVVSECLCTGPFQFFSSSLIASISIVYPWVYGYIQFFSRIASISVCVCVCVCLFSVFHP